MPQVFRACSNFFALRGKLILKKFFFAVLLTAMCMSWVFGDNLSNNSRIEINIPLCVGSKATPTPQGQYSVVYKTVAPYWLDKDTVVPPGPQNPLGIHGNNKPESIGTFASAGCIRMYNRDVVIIYPDCYNEGRKNEKKLLKKMKRQMWRLQ